MPHLSLNLGVSAHLKGIMGDFYGIKLIPNESLVRVVYEEVRRSWKERLFSLPFRPFQKTKIVTRQVPLRKLICVNKNTYYVHPEILEEIKQSIPSLTCGFRENK